LGLVISLSITFDPVGHKSSALLSRVLLIQHFPIYNQLDTSHFRSCSFVDKWDRTFVPFFLSFFYLIFFFLGEFGISDFYYIYILLI
jgi:hypothetical protein